MTVSSLATFLPSYIAKSLKTPVSLSLSFIILNSPTNLLITILDSCHLKFGIEIYIDNEAKVMYIQKIDSNLRVKGLALTCIRGLLAYFKTDWYIYAATGKSYLFPSSHKPLRDDRSLIKWWMTVVDVAQEKWIWIPGETQNSTKSLFPSDSWKWGLSVQEDARATVLPRYEDDLVTKAMAYADRNATVKDLMGIMECMELHAGLRALLWLRDDEKTNTIEFKKQFQGLKKVDDLEAVVSFLTSLDFGTIANSKKSTVEFLDFLGMELDSLPMCKVEATLMDNQIGTTESSSKPVKTISSSLVKKKAVTMINPGLIKKKAKLS